MRVSPAGGSPVLTSMRPVDRLLAQRSGPKPQQRVVNTWMANRDHSVVCFKVSAQREAFKTFRTRDGFLIEQPHDYSEVRVDELYTQSKTDYSKKVKLIAEKRLTLSVVPTKQIEKFLPVDPREAQLLAQFKDEAAAEWETVGEPGRQSDFVYRYATARLFQHLRATHQRKSYAGFDNIVHLSSGVVRDLLEPCYLMFDRYVSQGRDPTSIQPIPSNLQDEMLFDYSEDFVLQKYEDIRKDLPSESWSLWESLGVLVASLGQLFYERLHDPQAREARLFSFTVRGRPRDDLAEVLRLGVRFRYFQLRTRSTKEGGGRQRWYILNRRLCPVFKLDPSGFEGRISLTVADLRLACQDPARFVRSRLRLEVDDPQLPLFVLEEVS